MNDYFFCRFFKLLQKPFLKLIISTSILNSQFILNNHGEKQENATKKKKYEKQY